MVVFSKLFRWQVIMSFLPLEYGVRALAARRRLEQRVLEVIDTEPLVTDGTHTEGKPGEVAKSNSAMSASLIRIRAREYA